MRREPAGFGEAGSAPAAAPPAPAPVAPPARPGRALQIHLILDEHQRSRSHPLGDATEAFVSTSDLAPSAGTRDDARDLALPCSPRRRCDALGDTTDRPDSARREGGRVPRTVERGNPGSPLGRKERSHAVPSARMPSPHSQHERRLGTSVVRLRMTASAAPRSKGSKPGRRAGARSADPPWRRRVSHRHVGSRRDCRVAAVRRARLEEKDEMRSGEHEGAAESPIRRVCPRGRRVGSSAQARTRGQRIPGQESHARRPAQREAM